jgi:hypothetical protein
MSEDAPTERERRGLAAFEAELIGALDTPLDEDAIERARLAAAELAAITHMRLSWSPAHEGRVIYETYSFAGGDPTADVTESSTWRNQHEVPIRSRADAERIAVDKGFLLERDGDPWDGLPAE